jgi:hypothetical protein
LGGCAANPALKPSDLNTHPDLYDGQRVTIRGWVIVQFESYHIWDSRTAALAPSKDLNPVQCVSLLGRAAYTSSRGEYRTMTGTYWKDFATSVYPIDLGACNDSGFMPDVKP